VQGRLQWPPRESAVYKALLGQQLSVDDFNDLDDVSVLHCFKLWAKGDDAVLVHLCRGLLFRRVYKTIDLSRVEDPQKARSAVTAVERAIAEAGGEPGYEMFYDQPLDTPYETYQEDGCGAENEILVRDRAGKLTPFAAISPLVEALNRQLMFRRIHVAPQWHELARESVGRV
jgi:HD superfamily phosphohydrolase